LRLCYKGEEEKGREWRKNRSFSKRK